MLQQRQELNQKIAALNLATATLETDYLNPMVFDVKSMKQQI